MELIISDGQKLNSGFLGFYLEPLRVALKDQPFNLLKYRLKY